MNVLAARLRDDPEIVNRVLGDVPAQATGIPFDAISAMFPPSDELDRIGFLAQVDPAFAEALLHARLGVVTATAWNAALREAEPLPVHEADEWVTMTPSRDGEVGLTLPDDQDPTARWSMFDGRGPVARPLVVELDAPRPSWRVSETRHCGFPERAQCAIGTCGTCRLRHRRGKQSGLVCVCDHRVS